MSQASGELPDEDGLLALLEALRAADYHFVTVTPETHRRVVERREGEKSRTLRDVFGWNLPFDPATLPPRVQEAMAAADAIVESDQGHKSRYRVACIDEHLFVHSAWPTDEEDAVFFGPDTYRFIRFLRSRMTEPARHLVDIGAGAGVGGLCMKARGLAGQVTLTDVNPRALALARVNARFAGLDVATRIGSGLDPVDAEFDAAIMNPPFIVDPAGRQYRDGGAMHGGALSLDWALSAARRLARGGRAYLYTGSAIVAGKDGLKGALEAQLPADCGLVDYEEIDPDIFGEELDGPGYEEVERIAAVGAVIHKA